MVVASTQGPSGLAHESNPPPRFALDGRLRRARPALWLAAAGAVPISSLLGLSRAMSDLGAETFGRLWASSFWGDLAFVAGTLAAFTGSWVLAERPPRSKGAKVLAAAALAFAFHFATYVLAWSLSADQFVSHYGRPGWAAEGLGFFEFHWAAETLRPDQLWGLLDTGVFGILAMTAVAAAGSALVMEPRSNVRQPPAPQASAQPPAP